MGHLGLNLTAPFELVHNAKPNSKTRFELFSIWYLNHDTDNTESGSKMQAHTLYGISAGRDDRSNSIIFYNPITSSYYHPHYLWLYESRLPIPKFPNSLRFDEGLTCGLLQNKTDPIRETFPPGNRVSIQYNDALDRGNISNIPNPVSPILKSAASPFPNQSDKSSI